jgi:hypothetical protein
MRTFILFTALTLASCAQMAGEGHATFIKEVKEKQKEKPKKSYDPTLWSNHWLHPQYQSTY